MGFFERYTNSKLYHYVDQFFRVIITNLLAVVTIVFGLFFFGIGAAIIASTYLTKLIFEKYEGPVIGVFYNAVKRNLKTSIKITLLFTVILAILIFNTMFFFNSLELEFTWLGFIGFILMSLATFVSFNAYIHTLLLSTCYEQSKVFVLVKNGYVLTFGFFLRSIIFSLFSLGVLALVLWIPILGILIGVFLEAIVIYICFLKGYKKIPNFENRDDMVADSYIK